MSGAINIRMTAVERVLFERYVSRSRHYLEFGCGGSTEIAENTAGIIVSVESDPLWVTSLRSKEAIAKGIRDSRIFIDHVDIGPVGAWGIPTDESKIKRWPRYAIHPFVQYEFDYDFVLIDGRFRRSCAYAAFFCTGPDTTVAIHDYANRSSYYEIEKFYNIVQITDTLAIMKKKEMILNRSLFISLMKDMFEF